MATRMAAAIATRLRHSDFQKGSCRFTCSAGSAAASRGGAGFGAATEGFGFSATVPAFGVSAADAFDAGTVANAPSALSAGLLCAAVPEAAGAVDDPVLFPNVWHSLRKAVNTVCARASLLLIVLSNSLLASTAVAKLRP